jgi:competence protein ComEC
VNGNPPLRPGVLPARTFFLQLTILLIVTLMPAESASAQQVVVARHVTVRMEPNRQSDVVEFPEIGEQLTLLDAGVRRHGYYHVRLQDGRSGWVYYTFVRRPQSEAGVPPSAARDLAVAHFIDVDQGNAALLEFPCGAVLIDAGGRTTAAVDHLIGYLESFFARRTDLNRHLAAVFITHTHIDHNRGLRRVAETFSVDGYIHNGVPNGSGRNNAAWMKTYVGNHSPPIPELAIDDATIAAAGITGQTGPVIDPVACQRIDPDIRVFSGRYRENPGWSEGDFDNGNNHSLVIRVAYGRARILFTGDLEEPAIETLLARPHIAGQLDADVYVVGHHGADNGTIPALLAAMTPQIALFSMGDTTSHVLWTAWKYGHPRRSAVAMIDQVISRARVTAKDVLVADGSTRFSAYHMTDALYATGWDGDVRITAHPDATFDVETGR